MNRRVAVVGSGISGLGAAYALRHEAHVTLFEADTRFGGHAHTVDVTLEGVTHGVDTGFLVYNERTYPKLIQLFAELGVETALSDMSFSVQVPGPTGADGRRSRNALEWNGSTTNSVFAQRSNLFKPRFWRMIRDILRFNREATAIAERNAESELQEPIGEHLQRHAYSAEFRDWYLLPMIGCIWSCPTDQMLRFPIATLIRFCHNHGLIQVEGRPRWYTVRGGSRQYVEKVLPHIPDARAGTPVRRVVRQADGSVEVHTDAGAERFDAVIMAGHSDQSLGLLAAPTPEEAAVLGAIRYHDNTAVLHTDASVLPERRLAWASWNYERAADTPREQAAVCLHYLLNMLQPLPWQTPTVVSLNPVREIDPARVIRTIDYAHPVFDGPAVEAQKRLPGINGHGSVWFCGAWTRYGFHEDGLMSGQAAAEGLLRQWESTGAVAGAVAGADARSRAAA